MNRRAFVILAFLLVLYIGPVNLAPAYDTPAISNESQFIISADGDESSESITSFSETPDDDIWLFPDGELNYSGYEIDETSTDGWTGVGFEGGDSTGTAPINLHADDDVVGADGDGIYTNTPTGYDSKKVASIEIEYEITTTETGDFFITLLWYAEDDLSGTENEMVLTEEGVGTHTQYTPVNMWIQSIALVLTHEGGDDVGFTNIEIEHLHIYWDNGEGYADSFKGVDDWSGAGGIVTDDDIGSYDIPSDTSYPIVFSNTPSLTTGVGYYLEYRIKANSSGAGGRMRGFSADDRGGVLTYQTVYASIPTSWTTYKHYIPSLTYTEGAIECVVFYYQANAAVTFYIDYIRISPADEMGWQSDFSTTTGISSADGGTIATDGDAVTLTANGDGSTFIIVADTTATATAISCTYYPFFSIDIDSGSGSWTLEQYDGSAYATLQSSTAISAGTKRFNMRALDTYVSWWRITLTASGSLVSDWAKAGSIANFTYSGSSVTTDDYLYVDSSILYSHVDDGYIEANHDPALSVSDTYSVWNLTTGSTAPEFDHYVSSWQGYSSETCGALSSGTVTDIRIKFTADGDLSALKFIEDSTAPTISDFWTVPYTPTEDDDISLVVFTSDGSGVGAYSVVFNAVDYPAGFVDIDYDATESGSESGLWQVAIPAADVVAGYYAFGVAVSDGANVATSFEVFRVTTVYLQITEIVLITATETLAQISGHSNKDATYVIYENDIDSGSGSVSAGWFSISWTKDTTAGTYIELGVKFTSGVYSEWVNGSYSVASAVVLYVTDTVYSATDSYNYLSGHLNLGSVTWTAYDNDSQKSTGSLGTGSFSINWAKVFARGLHEWGVKFTDGTTTRWVNGSYEAEGLVVTDLFMMQNNESIIVGGYFYTSNLTLTWEAYEAGVLIDDGYFTLTTSGDYYSIYWLKNEPTTFNNFTLSITSDGSTINLHSYSLVLDAASYLYIYNSPTNTYEGDTYLEEGDVYEGIQPKDMATVVLELAVLMFLAVIFAAIITWRDGRNKRREDYLASVASGGYQ